VARNQALQPKPGICDDLNATNSIGHMQEVRLHEPWNIGPKEYCGAPKWASAISSLAFRVMRLHV
jgi:hypothetical protein